MSALRGELVQTEGALVALAPAWWALWHRSPSATPFQTPAWLLAWWRAFAPGELATLAVWRGDGLAGLAPLYIEDGPYGRRLLPIGISVSDYLDILLDPTETAQFAEALVDLGLTLKWDSWELEELRPEAAAWQLPAASGLCASEGDQSACPVLMLEPTPGWFPERMRAQHARALARAEKLGPTVFEAAGADPSAFLLDLEALHRARWSARGESGVLADPRVGAFHRLALPDLCEKGLARCYRLVIGGRLAGAYYGFLDRGRAYFYISGFDPAFDKASPGTLLVGHAIAAAASEGATEFHFLRGQERYKYLWGAVDRPNRRRSLRREAA